MDSSRLHNTRPRSDRSIWRRAAVHHVVRRRVENNTWQEEWVWRRGGRPRDDARTPRLPGDLPGDGGGACGSAGSSSWRTWRRCGAGTRESSVHRNFGQLTFGTSSEKRGGGLDPGDEKKKNERSERPKRCEFVGGRGVIRNTLIRSRATHKKNKTRARGENVTVWSELKSPLK
jgi:hypothetical protein